MEETPISVLQKQRQVYLDAIEHFKSFLSPGNEERINQLIVKAQLKVKEFNTAIDILDTELVIKPFHEKRNANN